MFCLLGCWLSNETINQCKVNVKTGDRGNQYIPMRCTVCQTLCHGMHIKLEKPGVRESVRRFHPGCWTCSICGTGTKEGKRNVATWVYIPTKCISCVKSESVSLENKRLRKLVEEKSIETNSKNREMVATTERLSTEIAHSNNLAERIVHLETQLRVSANRCVQLELSLDATRTQTSKTTDQLREEAQLLKHKYEQLVTEHANVRKELDVFEVALRESELKLTTMRRYYEQTFQHPQKEPNAKEMKARAHFESTCLRKLQEASHGGLKTFLIFIYKEYPPKRTELESLDIGPLDAKMLARTALVAIQHYHPDNCDVELHGIVWRITCTEITAILNGLRASYQQKKI